MNITEAGTADPDSLAPAALEVLHRLGQLGRAGAIALAKLVVDDDAHFDEAASWIADITAGALPD